MFLGESIQRLGNERKNWTCGRPPGCLEETMAILLINKLVLVNVVHKDKEEEKTFNSNAITSTFSDSIVCCGVSEGIEIAGLFSCASSSFS